MRSLLRGDLADVGIAVIGDAGGTDPGEWAGQLAGDGLGAAVGFQVGAPVPLAVPSMPVGAEARAAGWRQLAGHSWCALVRLMPNLGTADRAG